MQTSWECRGDTHSSLVPSSIMPGALSTLSLPKPMDEMTSAEHEYQDYVSSHYDDHPSIKDYDYSKPTTHDADDWKHLKYKPRWCNHCNGINKENNCRKLHPYTFTIEESPQPVGANFMNITSTEPSTFVDEDTWSVESNCPSGTGDDPTKEARCLECRARTSRADMERGICHGKCLDCDQRFSHATEESRLQCDIIGEILARNDTEDQFQ